MARAYLTVASEILDAFASTQQQDKELTGTRGIKVVIEGENLILGSIGNREGSVERDFEKLTDGTLIDGEAALVLFCVTDTVGEVPKWLLVAWVPEGCSVREKMLCSSSREDLRKAIGIGYFVAEFAANAKEDMRWANVLPYLSRDKVDPSLYSESERLIQEEKALAHIESGKATRSAAMGVLPFTISSSVIERLRDLQETGGFNWVEMCLESEEVHLVTTKCVRAEQILREFNNAEEPRFIVAQFQNSEEKNMLFFVFACADSAEIRTKMIMSSAKATVIARLKEEGVFFDRTFEVRSAEEFDDLLRIELSKDSATGPSSAAATINFSKPLRSGRAGSRKISKFTSDES